MSEPEQDAPCDLRFVGLDWAHREYAPPDAAGRAFPLRSLACRDVRCCGAITHLGGTRVLFVAEPEPLPERRAQLQWLAAQHPRMIAIHEAGHFVANRLHDRTVVRVSLLATDERFAFVQNAERPHPTDELARAIDNLTVLRAGQHAAAYLLQWIGDGGCEDDHESVEKVLWLLATFGPQDASAIQRAQDEAAARLAILIDEHAADIERIATAFDAARGRVLERAELDALAASIPPRWSS